MIYFSDGEINELPMILNEPCSEEGTLLHLATMVRLYIYIYIYSLLYQLFNTLCNNTFDYQ